MPREVKALGDLTKVPVLAIVVISPDRRGVPYLIQGSLPLFRSPREP